MKTVGLFQRVDADTVNPCDLVSFGWGDGSTFGLIAQSPDDILRAVRFSVEQDRNVMSLSRLDAAHTDQMIKVPDFTIKLKPSSLTLINYKHNPIGSVALTKKGPAIVAYPGGNGRIHYYISDGTIEFNYVEPSPFYSKWCVIVPDETKQGFEILRSVEANVTKSEAW